MRAALVLMIGTIFWLATPALSEAHKIEHHDHGKHNGYSQRYDDHRDYASNNRHDVRHEQKAWKKHRKEHRKAKKHWRKHHRHEPSVKVVYRDRWNYPLFPRIVINIPL